MAGWWPSGQASATASCSRTRIWRSPSTIATSLSNWKVHALGWSNGAFNLVHLAAEKPAILETAMFLHGSPRFTAEDQQRLAAERPELVDAFNGFSAEIRAAEAAGASREELDARLKTFILEGWFVHLMADRDTATERLRQIYADTRFSWRHSQYANSETAAGYNLADLLPSIPVRSLVMAGAHDVLPPENVRLLHEGLPDSRFVVFENSSHYAPIEEPLKFRATILEFLGIEP